MVYYGMVIPLGTAIVVPFYFNGFVKEKIWFSVVYSQTLLIIMTLFFGLKLFGSGDYSLKKNSPK